MYYIFNASHDSKKTMLKNLSYFMIKNKNKLFPWGVTVYLYILYVRCICLSFSDMVEYKNNHIFDTNTGFADNPFWMVDAVLITLLILIMGMASFLLYKKSRYFYAIILFPIFLALALWFILSIYILLTTIGG